MEYSKFSVKDLKTILDKKGVKGYSKYRKDELINILSKLENIEDEVEKEEKKEENLEIPLPPKFENFESIIQNEDTIEIEDDVKEEKNKNEVNDNEEEIQIEDDIKEENSQMIKPESSENIFKDPVKLFENFKPSLSISGDKKSEILKGMIQYKTAQKMMERQEIQNEINKVLAEVRVMRQEYLSMIDIIKKDLKEVRESFLMANLIILHNFSFLPLDKLPIFKSQKK